VIFFVESPLQIDTAKASMERPTASMISSIKPIFSPFIRHKCSARSKAARCRVEGQMSARVNTADISNIAFLPSVHASMARRPKSYVQAANRASTFIRLTVLSRTKITAY
jgi:hypothetical protein